MIFHDTQPHPPACWIRPLCSQLVPSSSPRIAWKTTRTAESCGISSWIRSTINFYICFWFAVALDDWQPLNNKVLFVDGELCSYKDCYRRPRITPSIRADFKAWVLKSAWRLNFNLSCLTSGVLMAESWQNRANNVIKTSFLEWVTTKFYYKIKFNRRSTASLNVLVQLVTQLKSSGCMYLLNHSTG